MENKNEQYIGSQQHWEDSVNSDYGARERRDQEQKDDRVQEDDREQEQPPNLMETNSQEGNPEWIDSITGKPFPEAPPEKEESFSWNGVKALMEIVRKSRDLEIAKLQSELSSLKAEKQQIIDNFNEITLKYMEHRDKLQAENERLKEENGLLAKSNQKLRIQLSDFKDQPRGPWDL